MAFQAKLPTLQSLRNNFTKGIEQQSTLEGAADGTFVALPSLSASSVLLINNSGVEIDVKRSNGDKHITMGNTITYNFDGIQNANQILIRRTDNDGSKPPVNVQFEYSA